jgi:hypothetical protein
MGVGLADICAHRHTVIMGLTLRSLTVASPNEVDIAFTDDLDSAVIVHRFHGETTTVGLVINGDAEWNQRYRRVPGPVTPMWPEQLAGAVLHATAEPMPAGVELDQLTRQAQAELTERWRRSQPHDEDQARRS